MSAPVEPSQSGIHQIIASASPGDAITNLALALRKVLRTIGPSEIFARHIAPALHGDVMSLADYRTRHARNLLILHASIGEPGVHDFIMARPEPLVLVYHNVTPPSYFDGYDLAFSELLDLGRREVEILRARVAGAIADSAYNARELEAMGYRNVRVVPPVVDVHRLARVEPRQSTLDHLASLNAPILLSVAQLMPHKRPDFLVEMMHVADTYLGMRGYLMLVGHHRLERYTRAILNQVRELNLVGVHVVGAVDEADLAAMYRSAAAVVTASEHEGFCLPLVEAMAFDVPVVARGWAAIPETVADAALVLPPHEGPVLYAEAVTELLANDALQDALVANGRRRVADFDAHPSDVAMVEALLEVV